MTPFADLPDTLTAEEVAGIMRLTRKAIYNGLSAGVFLPLPISERPHRWKKEDLETWRNGGYRDAIETLKQAKRRRLKAVAS